MSTITASGASRIQVTVAAARAAVSEARARLPGPPTFGFLFAGPEHDLRAALVAAREITGEAPIVAASTAGELTEAGLLHGGVVVLLVASDEIAPALAFGTGLRASSERVAAQLVEPLGAHRRLAAHRERRNPVTVLLTDGLSGAGERLVGQLHDASPVGAQIVGGAAGDEGRFESTFVGAGTQAASDAAAALHLASAKRWGVGVGHGLVPSSRPMRVTRSEGNVVHELDGAPAFAAYERHAAARGVTLTRENAGPYMIANELGILFFDKVARARAPLEVGADGSLTCAADVPRGALVSILDGQPGSMIDAARSAAEEAQRGLEGRPAGVLLFDCVCRGMILGDGIAREIAAVRSVFGDVPVAGFLTYGEIARYPGRLEGWHNTTAVVVAIPA